MLLLDLPVEVLQDICRTMCPHCVRNTRRHCQPNAENHDFCKMLSRFSRTCSVMRDIAQPVMFHYPVPSIRGFMSLVRTLCRRPDLARRVRIFDAGGGWSFLKDWELPKDDVEFFNAVMKKYPSANGRPFRVADRWWKQEDILKRQQLFECCPSVALSAISLAQITQVHRLSLCTLWETKFDYPFCPPGSLPHLAELTIENFDQQLDPGSDVTNVMLAAAPRLQYMKISWFFIDYQLDPTNNEQLVTLHLQSIRIRRKSLFHLLRNAKNLQTLLYHPGGSLNDDFDQVFPREASEAILMRADTLQRVSMDFTGADDLFNTGPRTRYGMVSLKKMEQLRYLRVDGRSVVQPAELACWPLLAFTDMLPASIESFIVYRPSISASRPLIHLGQHATTEFPKLRSVYLSPLPRSSSEESSSTQAQIEKAFKKTKSSVTLDSIDVPKDDPEWVWARSEFGWA